MLEQITPILMTYNEQPNIERTLTKLYWAKDIVIVDSFSTDDTVNIIQQFKQVRLFQRSFDSHTNQWNYALQNTDIRTEWVLALDADYVLTNEIIEELRTLKPNQEINGYSASFKYSVFGKILRGSLYPPVTVLYRHTQANYRQDGHTQRVVIQGTVSSLKASILHDDRKSLSHWLQAQDRYIKLELEIITTKHWHELRWADRVRKLRFFAPFVVLLYCLFIKGGIFDGRAGWFYAFQRMLAEMLLSLYLLQKDIGSTQYE